MELITPENDDIEEQIQKMKQLLREKEKKLIKYDKIRQLKKNIPTEIPTRCEKNTDSSHKENSSKLLKVTESCKINPSHCTQNAAVSKKAESPFCPSNRPLPKGFKLQQQDEDSCSHPAREVIPAEKKNQLRSNRYSLPHIDQVKTYCNVQSYVVDEVKDTIPVISEGNNVQLVGVCSGKLSVLEVIHEDQSIKNIILKKEMEFCSSPSDQRTHVLPLSNEDPMSLGILIIPHMEPLKFCMLWNLEKSIIENFTLSDSHHISGCCFTDVCRSSQWSFVLMVSCDFYECKNRNQTRLYEISFDVIHSKKKNALDLVLECKQISELNFASKSFFITQRETSSSQERKYLLNCTEKNRIALHPSKKSMFLSAHDDYLDLSQCVWVRLIQGHLFMILKSIELVMVALDISSRECYVIHSWKVASKSYEKCSASSLRVVFCDQTFYLVNSCDSTLEILPCPDALL